MILSNNVEKENKLEKIKQLNAKIAAGGEISDLSGRIRQLRSEVDSLLGRVREQERRRSERLRAEEEEAARLQAEAEAEAAIERVKQALKK